MRIIGGKFKGKNISFIKSFVTRPLKDSVKENIFNIMNHSNLLNTKIENSYVLDLYSGIGSFGIECISRGANGITFVEKNIEIAKILEKNLINFKIENKSKIFVNEIRNFLNLKIKKKFEIIFLDPPFKDNKINKLIETIKKMKITSKKSLIIIHRNKKIAENISKDLIVSKEKNYGLSKIIFGKIY